MVVVGMSEVVKAARKDVLELLLTSHPLDCPVCDKGGECPLQNLTMEHGPGASRFLYDEKLHMDKHVPLGKGPGDNAMDRIRQIGCTCRMGPQTGEGSRPVDSRGGSLIGAAPHRVPASHRPLRGKARYHRGPILPATHNPMAITFHHHHPIAVDQALSQHCSSQSWPSSFSSS